MIFLKYFLKTLKYLLKEKNLLPCSKFGRAKQEEDTLGRLVTNLFTDKDKFFPRRYIAPASIIKPAIN